MEFETLLGDTPEPVAYDWHAFAKPASEFLCVDNFSILFDHNGDMACDATNTDYDSDHEPRDIAEPDTPPRRSVRPPAWKSYNLEFPLFTALAPLIARIDCALTYSFPELAFEVYALFQLNTREAALELEQSTLARYCHRHTYGPTLECDPFWLDPHNDDLTRSGERRSFYWLGVGWQSVKAPASGLREDISELAMIRNDTRLALCCEQLVGEARAANIAIRLNVSRFYRSDNDALELIGRFCSIDAPPEI
jgi:hypothetical protein